MPVPIAYEEDFPDSPHYNPGRRAQQPQQQQQQQQLQQEQPQLESERLKEEAMRHMVLVWHKLVRADEEEAATAAENFGKEIFGQERFQDAMTAAVMDGGDSEPDVGEEI